MIAILPASEEERSALSAQAGFAGPVECLVASDGWESLGSILYRTSGEVMELLTAQAEDPRLLDGLLRAALNAALSAGARTARCEQEPLFPALRTLGFSEPEEGCPASMQADISGIFARGCPSGETSRGKQE
ncbi:MAG TPA: hypothetical protein H9694_09835 [Firmicutes bacterium]|nr:hypothetical protein [Bacillota bacterium]